MDKKYMYVVAILVIAMIGIGCIDKNSEKVLQEETPIQTNAPVATETPMQTSVPAVTETGSNISLPEVTETGSNIPSHEATNTPDITPLPNVTNTSDITPLLNTTDAPTEDTSVTKTFHIGDENDMIGTNVKLVNITDYDNNTVVLLINGVEYKYSSETGVQANGIEIVDVITLEDDKTAEITVDYVTK